MTRKNRFFAIVTVLFFAVSSPFLCAQKKSVRPGINDHFKNPNVASFVERFEREGREVYDLRHKIVELAGVKAGLTVADVGAGTGMFTRLFAKKVGSTGKVYAVDIAKNFLERIEKTSQEQGSKNVTTILCTQNDSKLPENSVDIVFICDTYHHFEFPYKTMKTIRKALKPKGKLVVIDFERIEGVSSKFIMGHVRAGKTVFTHEIKQVGFKQIAKKDILKENYFVIFEKAKPKVGAKGSE